MNYIFGPVPSRRLGRSLGIDPTPAESFVPGFRVGPDDRPRLRKICNWNCVYCQLGPTKPFTRLRTSFFPPSELLAELSEALRADAEGGIDWITFVGSGEPTLNRDLGILLRGVKSLTDIPVAVITNGSLLGSSELQDELSVADAVMPTLDAGGPALFNRINRPPAEFGFGRHLEGLVSFRGRYPGRLWLEVMLIAGLNDGEAALADLAAAIARIAPDEVHLLLPTRPPAESWVRPADEEGLDRARSILGAVARVVHPDEERGDFSLEAEADPLEAAAKILARHPMDGEDLARVLSRRGVADPEAAIRQLAESGRAVEVQRYGKSFWRSP